MVSIFVSLRGETKVSLCLSGLGTREGQEMELCGPLKPERGGNHSSVTH